jgi:hypothetical protein
METGVKPSRSGIMVQAQRGGILSRVYFYTDTNGQYPKNLSVALRLLEIAMETTPLDQINFEKIQDLAEMLDGKDWGEVF